MQLGASSLRSFGCFSIVLVGLCSSKALTHAEGGTGSYRGEVNLRGNYYWERSTRVIAPGVSGGITTPGGTRIRGGYLVDAITSASIAQGAGEDVAFTELRHQFDLSVGKEWMSGQTPVDLTGGVRVSSETDYDSISAFLSNKISWDERSNVFQWSFGFSHDEIRRNVRGGPLAGLDASFSESLDALSLATNYERIVTPNLTLSLGYQFGYLRGFLANAYRVSATGQRETHPDERFRHSLSGKGSYYVDATGTALRLYFRAYLDSWDIGAITPEIRIYQEIGKHLLVGGRYRFYYQTRAFFYEPSLTYEPDAILVSIDPKMSEFHSHLLGINLRLGLGFLYGSPFEFAAQGKIDLSASHIWNTNRFGNGVLAQAGLHVPFE